MTEAGGDNEMDPLVGTAIAKALGDSGAEGSKEAGRLLSRVLGPSADEIGEALRRYTSFRVGNVARIVEKADQKAPCDRPSGEVPPRVAHRLLEEGSYCDNELMAEYLGGVLAAARTPGGRDDRAVVWSDMVTSLSSLQLRAHFLLYREWAVALHGREDINIGADEGRTVSVMHLDLLNFAESLVGDSGMRPDAAMTHAITGLVRVGLLGDGYAWGRREDSDFKDSPFPYLLVVNISVSGVELYGWAQGEAGMTSSDFVAAALPFGEEDLPRLVGVALPRLPPKPEGLAEGGAAGAALNLK